MKCINLFIILSLSFALISCKDNITQGSGEPERVVIQPPVSADPDENISPIKFSGIESITAIKQTTFKVNWTPVDGAGSYQVFFLTTKGLELQKTYNHPKNNAVLTGLQPDTEYTVVVRLMDLAGRIDINEKFLKVKTNLWPDYNNRVSLLFSQSQGVSLASSNQMLNGNAFTASLWFKTSSNQAGNDNRLLTFHSSVAASTALSIGVDDNRIFLAYKDSSGTDKRLETQFSYSDNSWHHLVVTYNGRWFTLYIDGRRSKSEQDSLVAFGTHPASIGSFSGMRKSFDGLIDEVSIWSSAIGNGDIQLIYNNGQSNDLKQHRRAMSLTSWYRMGDEQGDNSSIINDTMGAHNATPVGIRSSDFIQSAP